MTPTAAGRALLDRFEAIRVINLPHRTDRRREMTAEFARLGLAVDGERVAFHDATVFDAAGTFDTIGMRGCFNSHLGVIEGARDAGRTSVLVLEDDCDFVLDADAALPPALGRLASVNWSVFYGGYLKWEPDGAKTGPVGLAEPGDPVLGGHFIAFRGTAIAEAADYLRAMLGRPPGSDEGGPMHVDGAYGWYRRAYPERQTWVATPWLGEQRSSRTDIHGHKWLDRSPLTRDAMSVARRVKRAISRGLGS